MASRVADPCARRAALAARAREGAAGHFAMVLRGGDGFGVGFDFGFDFCFLAALLAIGCIASWLLVVGCWLLVCAAVKDEG